MTALQSSSAYRQAIRIVPILCVGGLITTVAGNIGDKVWLFQFGANLFLSGVVVWGFANSFPLIYGLVHRARRSGFKDILAHPWPPALSTVWALFYLSMGAFCLWLILRTSLHPN
jgi:hypothetical protein